MEWTDDREITYNRDDPLLIRQVGLNPRMSDLKDYPRSHARDNERQLTDNGE